MDVFTSACGQGGPAIIFYMDAGGIRPAVLVMAQRLADAGYVVVVVPVSPASLLKRLTVGSSIERPAAVGAEF